MTDQPDMTATEVQIRQVIAPLERRLTTTADHVATELGAMSKDIISTRDSIELMSEWHKETAEDIAELRMNLAPAVPDKSEIYTALAAAQLEINNAEKNTENEFTKKKYADLASVMDAVRNPLAKNGIALFQITEDPGEGLLGIRTVLAHASGQTIQDHITMFPPKNDPQGVGSCRTYMRRYAILALCGIAGAEDDDAEQTKKDPNDYDRITVAEAEKILIAADELFGERSDAALAKMLDRLFNGITKVGDIKAGGADTALQNLKNAAELMAKAAAKKEATTKKLAAKEKAAKREADEEKPAREPGEDG